MQRLERCLVVGLGVPGEGRGAELGLGAPRFLLHTNRTRPSEELLRYTLLGSESHSRSTFVFFVLFVV